MTNRILGLFIYHIVKLFAFEFYMYIKQLIKKIKVKYGL